VSLAQDIRLRRLYALRLFIVRCILPNDYHFPADFDAAITLTCAGEQIFSNLIDANANLCRADAKAAVLAEFVSGDQLLVDHEQSNYDDIGNILSPDIAHNTIRYPWVYGDVLEEVYIESYGREAREYLDPDQTASILTRLPQGVFQLADITVGPFGMLKVVQQRCIPPSLCGPEISCN
jgi:hypothetical protein